MGRRRILSSRGGGRLFVAVCLGLAGCTVGPDYRMPPVAMPNRFLAASVTPAPGRRGEAVDAATWWRALGDPELNSLVDRALASNLDLKTALAHLEGARLEEAVVTGEAEPDLAFSAGGGWGTGSDLARGRASGPLVAAENTGSFTHVTHIVGFDTGWELDLFGKYRREREAAVADAQAALAARNAVLISVIADVARAYVDLRGLQMQAALLGKNIGVAQRDLDFTQERYQRGFTNALDVTLAQRQRATLQAEQRPLAAQIQAAQGVLAVLLGQFPEELTSELDRPGVIPTLPDRIDAGLPLTLLRRRPDIREAERNLAGATARIGVATADLFPQVALTAGAGLQGQGLGVTPVRNRFIWSAGPAVSWPVLDFGTLDALVEQEDMQTRGKLAQYKQTVLNAVREVDTALSAYAGEQDRLGHLAQALDAGQRAVHLATQRYDLGLTDALNVIDAERQEYALEDRYVTAQKAAAEQFIALYKALGGGWESYQSLPPVRPPKPAVLAAFAHLFSPPP